MLNIYLKWILNGVFLSFFFLFPCFANVPRLSDVAFSSRWVHPTGPSDHLNTLSTLEDFYATNLLWVYLTNPDKEQDAAFVDKVISLGIPIQATVSTAVTLGENLPTEHLNSYGTKLDIHQKMKTSFGTHTFTGCPSSPIFQKLITRKFTAALSFNVRSLQIDDWNFSYFAKIPKISPSKKIKEKYRVEKCYCNYCLENFRLFLKGKTEKELTKWEITDITTFDYRLYVLKKGWNPNRVENTLEKWYDTCAKGILTHFWDRNYKQIQEIAKRKITVSANNYQGQWAPIAGPFDFGLGEIGPPYTDPQYIFSSIQSHLSTLKRPQVYSFAPTTLESGRHLIAITTASGGNPLVPWDVYRGAHPRFYAQPKDFADLYGMIRALKEYIDGYESLYAGGWHLKDPKTPLGTIETIGTKVVSVYVRKKIQEEGPLVVHPLVVHPLVVHLVQASGRGKKFTLKLKLSKNWKAKAGKCTLHFPAPFHKESAFVAEKTKDFRPLVRRIVLQSKIEEGYLHVTIPPFLKPWGILVLENEAAL